MSFLVYIRLSCSQFTSPLLKLKVSLFLKLLFSLFSFVPQFGKGGELPLPGKCNLRSFELKKTKEKYSGCRLEREGSRKKKRRKLNGVAEMSSHFCVKNFRMYDNGRMGLLGDGQHGRSRSN